MMGGGGGGGGAVNVFQPPAQEEVARQMGQLAGPLVNAASNAGAGTPAGQNYPTAQNFVNRFLTGTGADSPFNDLATRAFQPAYTAGTYAAESLFPRGSAQGGTLNQLGFGGVPYAQQALRQGFDPNYGLSTPDFGLALGGARQGATLGGQGANQIYGQAQDIGGLVDPLITSGFDPQSALYGRSRDQLMGRTGAINAMAGLGGTPYGASVTANALGNFDMDWQNRQLARQAQAAEAARGAAGTAGALYGAAPGLAAGSAALPNQAILQQLAAANQGAASGLGNYGTGLQSIINAYQQAQGLPTQALQTAMQFGAAPYNLGQGMTSNALAGLQGATNIGQQQYQLPMQLLQSFQNYLTGGQNAAGLQNQLQNQQFNQQAAGIGGLFSGANTAFDILGKALPFATMLFSDRRLKTDIAPVGQLYNGLPVSLYRYLGDPTPRIGLMADEVERVHPEAVMTGPVGFKMVNYDRAVR